MAEASSLTSGQFFPTRGRALDNVEIAANATTTVRVVGVGAVPLSDVGSVAVSISAKGASGSGALVLYPSGATEPTAAALSYRTEFYAANTVTAKVGTDGNVKIANKGAGPVRVYLDIHGYTLNAAGASAGSTYSPLTPARIVNGLSVPAFGNYELTPLGKGGVPASDVEAVAFTLRAKATSTGTLRAYAAGDALPADATIDYASGNAAQNFAITKVGADGKINIHNLGGSAVTIWVDVAGYYTKRQPAGPTLRTLQPARLANNVSIAPGAEYTLAPLGQGGLPASSSVEAVSLSLTAKSTVAGALSTYPSGAINPSTQTVGFDSNIAAAGATIAKLGTDGKLVIRNTGTAAVTVSADVFGYFRKGLDFTKATVGPVDDEWTEGVRANSLSPTLTALATSPENGPVSYAFEVAPLVSDTPIASGTVSSKPSGQTASWQIGSGFLTNPGAYRFRVKASADGQDAIQTPWRFLLVDAPRTPTGLTTNLDDPAQPVLAGTVSRPSGGATTGRFYLYDAAGAPVGSGPLGEGSVSDGQQVAFQLPEGLVNPGSSYNWRLEACVNDGCTVKSAPVSFTVPAPKPAPPTQTLTISGDKVTVKSARIGAGACSGAPCPLKDAAQVTVGGAGDQEDLAWLKLDLGTLPAGAQVQSATLDLGQATCGQAACPGGMQIQAHQHDKDPTTETTGADLNSGLADEGESSAPVPETSLDISGMVAAWREDQTDDHGLVLKAKGATEPITFGTSVAPKPTLTITYVPPTAPGSVEVKARQGDQGALVTWGMPDDFGAAVEPTYQVQVLDSSGAEIRTVETEGLSQIITGLTNGAAYRFQVRAKSAFGTGPWTATGSVTPQAVPNGTQKYTDAIKQYSNAKEVLLNGSASAVEAALSSAAQRDLIRTILYSRANELIDWASQALGRKISRSSGEAVLNQSLVSAQPDGSVKVFAEIGGTTQFKPAADSDTVQDASVKTADFQFQTVAGQPQLVDIAAGGADDTVNQAGQINAFSAAQRSEMAAAEVDTPPALPVDQQGWPVYDEPQATTQSVSNSGTASWAINNVYKKAARYGDDCTNFVSKALRKGGHASYRGYWPYYTNNRKFWYQYKGSLVSRSYSWSASNHFYRHFDSQRRVRWRMRWGEVQKGDIMLWDFSGGSPDIGHVAVVSSIARYPSSGTHVWYAQHSDDYRYRYLSESWPSVRKKYPNARLYVFQVVK
ncbi:amidase domain-containing protein [Actinomadura barringtoniae]|uniref:Amidase domain-containing protein n=1 Tax=Actinomadura barringtoniae TaxID=1427535 RepID=A0A939T1A8_9ACTN|nr:amidase domain-containing protein [Actinomadura barringtoniae]MBO2447156.1 amidase domain-containing protein [Actinomadura barringtoniae]